jgi:GNAT superfamily N-acetyltransferase
MVLCAMGGLLDSNVVILRYACPDDVVRICEVLAEAFRPFRDAYTQHAYDATVVNEDEIAERIADPRIDVIVALAGPFIVGTVTLEPKGTDRLYIRSMAIRPDYQGRRIGAFMLEAAEQKARASGFNNLCLECYEALDAAMTLYERSGFRRTGKTRDYGGITVFEMVKTL